MSDTDKVAVPKVDDQQNANSKVGGFTSLDEIVGVQPDIRNSKLLKNTKLRRDLLPNKTQVLRTFRKNHNFIDYILVNDDVTNLDFETLLHSIKGQLEDILL
jgi:hypothetical protein